MKKSRDLAGTDGAGPSNESIHLANYPPDVVLRCSDTGYARPQDRSAATEANLRHPRDLSLMDRRKEPRGIQPVPREAHQWQGRFIDDPPPGLLQRFPQDFAHTGLVLDHPTYPDSPCCARARNSFRPINRRDHWTDVVYGSSTGRLSLPACRTCPRESFGNRFGMAAEEHPGAHRD